LAGAYDVVVSALEKSDSVGAGLGAPFKIEVKPEIGAVAYDVSH
jgi:hypothetical protein